MPKEERDDLNLFRRHGCQCVTQVGLQPELEERLGNDICFCFGQQATASDYVSMLQPFGGDSDED